MSRPSSRIKNHHREQKIYLQRAWFCFIAVALGFGILLIQLIRLQWLEHERFVTLSHNNRVSIHPIDPKRGLIFDRNGNLLAENIPEYSLQIRPDRVHHLKETLEKLKTIVPVSENEVQKFYKQWGLKRRFLGVPIKNRLNENELAHFAVHRHAFPEIELEAHLVRHYPYGPLLTHLLGYVGRINAQELARIDPSNYSASNYIGKTGIEQYYEQELHGTVGFQAVETDAKGRVIRTLSEDPPQQGEDLHLTLDLRYQQKAMALLAGQRGALVALNPQTGEILALASSPSFDPNPFVEGIDAKPYQQLQTDRDRPLYNRALRGLYAPASTIKPLLALEALHTNIVDPNQRIYDPGFYQLKGDSRQYRDWQRQGHGWVNLSEAIISSCDVYFYQLSTKLGIDRIEETLRNFGLGSKTGIDLPDELSGLVPSRNWKLQVKHQPWYPGETLSHGIGQGFTLATPLQMAVAVSTLANRGKRPVPHLIQTPSSQPKEVMLPYSAAAFEWVSDAMQKVFSDPRGTAYRYSPKGLYTVAGKSGTAQVVTIKQHEHYNANALDERLRDHAWFVGYAPVHNPQVALAIILENQNGAKLAARSFLDTFFNVPSAENSHDQKSQTFLATHKH